MKVLFIVQGEGRGASDLGHCWGRAKLMRRNGHEVVEVLGKKPALFAWFLQPADPSSGENASVPLPAQRCQQAASLARRWAITHPSARLSEKHDSYTPPHWEESGAELVINFYELLTG